MKRTTLRSAALLAAAGLLLSATACAGAKNPTKTESSTETALSPTAPTQSTEDAPQETEAPTLPTEAASTEPAPTDAPTEEPETEAETISAGSLELEFTQSSTSGELGGLTYTISYPEVSTDPAYETAFNDLISSAVASLISYGEGIDYEDDRNVTLTVNQYNITRNDSEYLSILWVGDYFVETAAHPNIFTESIIIDKSSMQIVSIGELYTLNEAFAETVNAEIDANLIPMLAEKLGVMDSELADAGVSGSVDINMLIQDTMEVGTEYSAWLTDDGVAFAVSIAHVYGDYCPVVVPYETLAAYEIG